MRRPPPRRRAVGVPIGGSGQGMCRYRHRNDQRERRDAACKPGKDPAPPLETVHVRPPVPLEDPAQGEGTLSAHRASSGGFGLRSLSSRNDLAELALFGPPGRRVLRLPMSRPRVASELLAPIAGALALVLALGILILDIARGLGAPMTSSAILGAVAGGLAVWRHDRLPAIAAAGACLAGAVLVDLW